MDSILVQWTLYLFIVDLVSDTVCCGLFQLVHTYDYLHVTKLEFHFSKTGNLPLKLEISQILSKMNSLLCFYVLDFMESNNNSLGIQKYFINF
jgi:hypothetical protein